MEWTEEEDPNKAAEKFLDLMAQEKAPGSEICEYIDKIIEKKAWLKK